MLFGNMLGTTKTDADGTEHSNANKVSRNFRYHCILSCSDGEPFNLLSSFRRLICLMAPAQNFTELFHSVTGQV